MKFLRLEVENFRPYVDEWSLDFSVDPQRPITLVFGKNGGGKTSLLTSLYWCLYGTLDLEEDKDKQNLVNDHAVMSSGTKAAPVTARVVLWVAKEINGTDQLFRLERKHLGWMEDNVHVESKGDFTVERITPPPSWGVGDPPSDAYHHSHADITSFTKAKETKDQVNLLLPKVLGEYFFYPGETLSFPFKNDRDSRGKMKTFLKEISGQNRFRHLIDSTDGAKQALSRKSDAEAKKEVATRGLQDQIDALDKKLEAVDDKLTILRGERAGVSSSFESVDNQLKQYEEFRDLIDAAKAAADEVEQAGAAVEKAEADLSRVVGSAYLHIAGSLFDRFVEVFHKKPYPNDVSEGLLKQLETSKTCLCGEPLTDSQLVEIKKGRAPGSDAVVTRMIQLHGKLHELRTADIDDVDRARTALDTAITVQKAKLEAHERAEQEIDDEGGKKHAALDAKKLQETRATYKSKLNEIDSEITNLTGRAEALKEERAEKEAEKTKRAPKGHRTVHHAKDIAVQVDALVEAIRLKQASVARGQLEQLVNDHYVVYRDDYRIHVDEGNDVRVYYADRGVEKPLADLSGSETALLTYAFAAAAARLLPQYQTLKKLLTTVPTFKEVEPIPLTVDAPFSNLGPSYKRKVVEILSAGFSQAVVFTEAVDLDVWASEANNIGAEYVIQHHGQLREERPEDKEFKWRGTTHVYVDDSDPDPEAKRSTIYKIES